MPLQLEAFCAKVSGAKDPEGKVITAVICGAATYAVCTVGCEKLFPNEPIKLQCVTPSQAKVQSLPDTGAADGSFGL